MARARSVCAFACVLALVPLGCGPKWPELPATPQTEWGFSGERAMQHVNELVALGPRVSGTPGAQAAREYIRTQLEALGLEVEEHTLEYEKPIVFEEGAEPELVKGTVVNLEANIPGESEALILLMAPYDTAPTESFELLGANEGASGPALLLELARVLQENPLPYTVRFAFLDGETTYPDNPFLGAMLQARLLDTTGDLRRLRMVLFVNQVADAELTLARDLRSHRVFRETFFRAAAHRGHADVFSLDLPFESVPGGHTVLDRIGFRGYVALVDTRYGGEESPGMYWRTADDDLQHCSAASLETVGTVAAEALHDVSALLMKVDRFATAPVADPDAEDAVVEEAADELEMEAAEADAGSETSMDPGEEAAPAPEPAKELSPAP